MDIKLSPVLMVFLCIIGCLISFSESSTFIIPNSGHTGKVDVDLLCCIPMVPTHLYSNISISDTLFNKVYR